MLISTNKQGDFFLPHEEVERIEQIGTAAQLCCELLDNYGNTPEVRRIIGDCMRDGYPRTLFEGGENGRF